MKKGLLGAVATTALIWVSCSSDEEMENIETAARNTIGFNVAAISMEKKLEEGAVIYGLTTGFGKFANVVISREEAEQLQKNLIISHTCAMGEPYETKYVRAAMLLRCNALSRGNSGIRLETIQTMIDMLNAGIHPVIPEKGSLGASGDLAPLSHIALALISSDALRPRAH